jgi:hypothetical protein
MPKLRLRAVTVAMALFVAPSAYAMGGGPIPPEASPYAILEPQTVTGWSAPAATFEGRAADTDGYGAARSGGEVVRERRRSRSYRHVPAPD